MVPYNLVRRRKRKKFNTLSALTHEKTITPFQQTRKITPFFILHLILFTQTASSCAVKKRTEQNVTVAVKDTVSVERSVQTGKYGRDTLIIERVVTEYYPDTAGNWIPARRSVTEGKDVAVRLSAETETAATVSTASADMKVKYTEFVEQQKFSRWRWFLAGAVAMAMFLAGLYFSAKVF